jgi:hypothetical protein
MKAKKSKEVVCSFYEFDGWSIAELKKFLEGFSDESVIDVRSEKVFGFGDNIEDREFFVIVEK